MSIEPDRDQFFQYATYAVAGLTLVICLCYGLIFLNPRVNPIGALQPVVPTAQVSKFELPPTWTPTATIAPTDTPTPEPTGTATPVPPNTAVPTFTPLPTNTRIPTRVPATRVPATRVPATPRPPAPPATPIPPPSHFNRIKYQASKNCGTWYLQGTLWDRGYGNGFVPGTIVRAWFSGGGTRDAVAGSFNKNNPGYWEMVFPNGQVQDGSLGIVDAAGNGLSPTYSFHLTKGCTGSSSVNEIIMDFARQ